MPEPAYTPENMRIAYQLNWSYALFWHYKPTTFEWWEPLQAACEPDGIRLLKHQFETPCSSQFLVSTLPNVSPRIIAQRIKGRLQHHLRSKMPDAFRRNYSLRSIGSTRRDKVEAYVAAQLGHHPLADERVQAHFAEYQIHDEAVDLSVAQETAHARYWYNLHLVVVMRDRARHVQQETLSAICRTIRNASAKKGHRLSRAAILPDHLHLTLGCKLEESPEEVTLSYMNNLAYATSTRLFDDGCWMGTFGEYDLGAIRQLEG